MQTASSAVFIDGFVHQLPDIDPDGDDASGSTRSTRSSTAGAGPGPATSWPGSWSGPASRASACPAMVTHRYINTIPPEQEPWFPGDEHLERRIRALHPLERGGDGRPGQPPLRRASAATSRRTRRRPRSTRSASTTSSGARTTAASATRSSSRATPRPASTPARSSRAGSTEEHLDRFRREVGGGGLPSYPHPRRMPDFWEFPTVSMGLGPINAVVPGALQPLPAPPRDRRHERGRRCGASSATARWTSPSRSAGLSIAAREQLDNLIFVVNCNLQRLDGPVRGNGKIIQELEAIFRGAGWNVIKVDLGPRVGRAARPRRRRRARQQDEHAPSTASSRSTRSRSGAYIREHFFGPDPRLRQMVEHLSDEDLRKLPRGGHDYRKLYAAYKLAVEHEGSPTVILAKTIKGWTLGADFEARNATHQIKKMTDDGAQDVPRPPLPRRSPTRSSRTATPPYYHPGTDSPEYEYMMARRRALDGSLPERVVRAKPLALPGRRRLRRVLAGTGEKVQASTTTAFARLLRNLLARPEHRHAGRADHPRRGAHVRARRAVPRRARSTRRSGSSTSRSTPSCCSSYREAKDGRILEEGITEAGSMASFTAAGTSYATWGQPMIPFFIFYSMFGFQRVGDLIWAFGDQRGPRLPARRDRGPHHAHRRGAAALRRPQPACSRRRCRTAAPTTRRSRTRWRVIVRDGIERMYGDEPEDCFYYLTLYNENYSMPAMPDGRRGRHRPRPVPVPRRAARQRAHRAQILAQRHRDAAPRSRRSSCSPTSTTSPPTCGARRATSCCARTRSRSSAGTGCTRPSRRACRTSPSSSATPRARSSRSPTS